MRRAYGSIPSLLLQEFLCLDEVRSSADGAWLHVELLCSSKSPVEPDCCDQEGVQPCHMFLDCVCVVLWLGDLPHNCCEMEDNLSVSA